MVIFYSYVSLPEGNRYTLTTGVKYFLGQAAHSYGKMSQTCPLLHFTGQWKTSSFNNWIACCNEDKHACTFLVVFHCHDSLMENDGKYTQCLQLIIPQGHWVNLIEERLQIDRKVRKCEVLRCAGVGLRSATPALGCIGGNWIVPTPTIPEHISYESDGHKLSLPVRRSNPSWRFEPTQA